MNIESKLWKIQSAGGGIPGFSITNKTTGETRYVSSAPSAHALAVMSESEFDKTLAQLFNAG